MSLKAGDIVRLKSGGPLMTITSDQGDVVECQWFKDNILNTNNFMKIALEEYQEPNFNDFGVHIP